MANEHLMAWIKNPPKEQGFGDLANFFDALSKDLKAKRKSAQGCKVNNLDRSTEK